LHDFYHDRRIRHSFEFGTILECWRLCVRGTEVRLSDGRLILLENTLGLNLGTRVCMEEIIARYYFNAVQGWVYFGAMILLIFVGLRFAGVITERMTLVGIGIEAMMLLVLSMVTHFLPNDDAQPASLVQGKPENLLSSINQSVQGMTDAVSDLFRLISQTDMRQDILLTKLTEYISKVSAENTRLQIEKLEETNQNLRSFGEMIRTAQLEVTQRQLEKLDQTNESLQALSKSMESLHGEIRKIIGQSIDSLVTEEIGGLLSDLARMRVEKRLAEVSGDDHAKSAGNVGDEKGGS